jgi:ABC-type transporter Mla subunit MlaD
MRHASPKRPSFLAGITVAGGLLAAALCGCQTAPVATSPPSPATPGVTGRAEPTETVVDGIPVRVRDWPVGSRVAPGAV